MIVEVTSIADFLDEIDDALSSGQSLLEGCARARIDNYPQQAEAVSFDIALHLSAVVCDEGRPVYLLSFSQAVGEDDGPEGSGTKRATEMRETARKRLEAKDQKLRRGKIEVL